MLRYVRGDIFQSKAQTLVNPVNCRGVMGKGLALEFKNRFHGLFEAYTNALLSGNLGIGNPSLWKGPEKWVVNFPTKADWRKPSQYEYIKSGLSTLRNRLKDWDVKSLALPPLGCGLGSLDWQKVKTLIDIHLSDLPTQIEVYEP